MNRYKYCPECNIGLNSREMEMRICQNCKHSWGEDDELYDEDYEDNQRIADEELDDDNDW